MVPPLLPLIAGDWTLSPLEVGLVNTVYAVGRLGATYPASRARARHGTRAVTFLGLGILIAGALACGLAPGFPAFLAGRALMGLGTSAMFLAVFGEVLESASPAWRGRLVNAFEGLAILSLGVGGMLGAWLAEATGWRRVFLAAAPVLLGCVLTWPRLDPAAGRRDARPAATARVGGAGHRRLAPVYGASLALAMTWSGLFATLAPLLGHEGYGLGAGALGAAMGAGYVAEILGLVVVGLAMDRGRAEPIFPWGAGAVVAGGLLMALGAHSGAFVLGLVLVGGGFAVWMVPAAVLSERVGTPLPPAYLAVYRLAMDTGTIAGPLLLGGVADLLGARAAAGSAGFLLVAGAVALGRSRR
jgi:MFS family permease